MSRIESQAVGGFYKTQDEVRPLIYRRFAEQREVAAYCIVDPCAGEGEAVVGLVDYVFGRLEGRRLARYGEPPRVAVELVVIELERERCYKAQSAAYRTVSEHQVHHGDGLACDFQGAGASLLWLNPPYDFFRGQRFEARFLRKWAGALAPGGQLVLIVPEHALPYLSDLITTSFEDVDVLRYPEPTYHDFKQVVVFGRKRGLPGEVSALPPIFSLADEPVALRRLPPGKLKVDLNALDVRAVLDGSLAWGTAAGYDRPAQPPRIGLAMKPKPAHVAMALGSGVFNGVRLAAPGQPDLLAKAVFVRKFVDAETKRDEKGEVVKLTQVERPQLRLTTLNLQTGEYRELSPGTEPSGSGAVENFADLLLAYGDSMVGAMRERCPSLHEGQSVELSPMTRRLFPTQHHAAVTALKLLHRGETPLVLGEIGSGKSSTALQIAWSLSRENIVATSKAIRCSSPSHPEAFPALTSLQSVSRVLVVCPPHLVQNWIDEAAACLPGIPVRVLERCSDVDAVAGTPAPFTIAVLNREAAKLGHGVEGITAPKCPACGTPHKQSPEKLAGSRAVCSGQHHEPLDRLARIAYAMSRLHQRGAKWKSDAFLPLRREAAVALLRYLLNHSTRLKKSYESKRVCLNWDAKKQVVEALMLCAPDPRVLRCLKLSKACGHDNWGLRGFSHAVDDFALMQVLRALGRWRVRDCGSPLFQAIPTPRRYPLAEYITRRHPDLFQLLIADEFHEYSTDGSAQERALHRLTEKIPLCLPLTGSLMNGYAKSLFRNLWAVSRRMRAEFAYDEGTKFAKLYGYQKRVLTGEALKTARAVEFGSASDRVTKTEGGERMSDAPGVLPSFVLRHVLPLSVTLHKRDIMPDDRVVDHDRQELAILDKDHLDRGYRLGSALKDAVKRDRFDKERAGKLFGQLAEFPSYYDRATADVGNTPLGRYEIRYPEDIGGDLVAGVDGLPPLQWLVKEEWLRRLLRRELDEGRNILIFLWHKELAERLQRLCRDVGQVPAFLDASKVQAKKRQDWIDKNVVGKRRILITNPSCVQTGLNNLIWFSTAVFFENPGCNPFVARQAVGRLDRITQTKEVRVYWPVYEGVQAKLLDLLQAKTAISQQIDGIDPTAALEMAGGGDAAVETHDVGLAIYQYLGGD